MDDEKDCDLDRFDNDYDVPVTRLPNTKENKDTGDVVPKTYDEKLDRLSHEARRRYYEMGGS